jgi:SNF2 family DNA or RNA helicase
VFDVDADEKATRVALRLFPALRMSLAPEVLKELDADPDTRPFDAATPWAGDRDPAELLPNVPPALRDKLYSYQAIDLGYVAARIRADGGAYVGWDRGLGKTLGAVALCYELGVGRAIVVCPNSSKTSVWVPEFEKWDVDRRYAENIHNLGGTAAQRRRALAGWEHDGGILLIHYEALRLVDWSKVTPADLVVVDEAHRLANGSASAKSPLFYKALKQIKTKYKLAMSGSIVANSPEDFFGANHWLFPNIYRSKWRDWNDKYLHFVEGGFGRVLIGVRADKVDAMREELGRFTVVRKKKDELPGLPDRIEQTLRVELSSEQRRVYDDIADRFIATLPDGQSITVGSHLGQLTKLRQIATGLDLLGESVTDSSKLDLAESLITDNLPNKTVVFAWHRATVHALSERLTKRGIVHGAITGDTSMAHRTRVVEQFQTNPDCKVIIATIKTLGESVTLHAAADLIFLESSWTPTDMEQAADRVYRIGQSRHVTITHIVAADTVDETSVLPRVTDKAAMKRLVLGGN